MYTKRYAKSLLCCLSSTKPLHVHGSDTIVQSLTYDSRCVQPCSAFFALPGLHTDGSTFIDDAIAHGAVAIIHEKPLSAYHEQVLYVQVTDVRTAMADAAAVFFEEPSKGLITIGVTGTEGKTSTVDFIWQLLRLAGKKAGFSSTVSFSFGGEPIANPAHQTTPESITVQERLARMRDNGCEYAVIEASSHGLSPRTARLLHVYFDVGICMNVTQEHLEFHGTFEQYRFDKAMLFRNLEYTTHVKKNTPVVPFGIVNLEDASAAYFAQATKQPVFGFALLPKDKDMSAHNGISDPAFNSTEQNTEGFSGSESSTARCTHTETRTCACIARELFQRYAGGIYAEDVQEREHSLIFTVHTRFDHTQQGSVQKTYTADVPITGFFNVYNIMAALITVYKLTEIPFDTLILLLSRLLPVRGRMSRVEAGQDFEIIIDYAHTPSSFKLIMPPICNRIKKKGGKVIAVFGSGGERDTIKRPKQGSIAGTYCDIIILTDEDPRGEEPCALLEMIAAGCPEKKRGEELFIIPDRPTALRKAFSLAKPNDAVLLLGKGHENSIIGKNGAIPYDEYREAQDAIRELLAH